MIKAIRSSRRGELIELNRRHLRPSPEAYIKAYESITAKKFVPDDSGATPVERIRKNLSAYFT